ncbi:MAG: ATP-binding protein [Oscillospiraceae bacterium]|nr:ATP-binding protein [Oscillospiraceae bacterium]
MSLNEKYYAAAHFQLDKRREYNRALEEKRRDEVLKKLPEYSQLEARLALTASNIAPAILSHRENITELIENLRRDNLNIQKNMMELLAAGGFPADYLAPIYTCPICKDKGCSDGKWCGCFMKLVYAAASKDMNEQAAMTLSRFVDFNLNLYPDAPCPDNPAVSQKSAMTEVFTYCFKFAENFDGSESGILMMGATGLGKTHLSLAIANRVIERGYSVIYGSTPEILRTLNSEQFGRSDGDTMSLLMGCDLLVLDDLGAENSSEYNLSQIYEIINARINRRLPMIVSTNFSVRELPERYSDRICSRLFSMYKMLFYGSDNRLKVNNQN